jgi:hypothetical protein
MMSTMSILPRIPAHLRGPALVIVAGAVAFAVAAFAATAGAQVDGAPVPGGAPDPLAGLLTGAGPAGGLALLVGAAWKHLQAEAQRHATERAELRRDLQALTGAVADVRHALDLERARHDAATQRLHDLLTAARAAAEART